MKNRYRKVWRVSLYLFVTAFFVTLVFIARFELQEPLASILLASTFVFFLLLCWATIKLKLAFRSDVKNAIASMDDKDDDTATNPDEISSSLGAPMIGTLMPNSNLESTYRHQTSLQIVTERSENMKQNQDKD